MLSRHDLQERQRCTFVFGDVLFEMPDSIADPCSQDRVGVLDPQPQLAGFFLVVGDGRVGINTIAAERFAVVAIRFTVVLPLSPQCPRFQMIRQA